MKQTPMLQQYLELKSRHRDSLMLYRLGDFYELFFEDAETAAPILGLVLTRRRQNDQVTSPMCGIPHHALAAYVGKLLEAGFKVAIAEQMEDPAQAGGLVRREVVRILTPGTVTEPELLGDGERRWVVALAADAGATALAFLEVASGAFGGALCAGADELRELLAQLRPREALLAEGEDFDALWPVEIERPLLTVRPAAWFGPGRGEETLRGCLRVGSLRAFELEPGEALVGRRRGARRVPARDPGRDGAAPGRLRAPPPGRRAGPGRRHGAEPRDPPGRERGAARQPGQGARPHGHADGSAAAAGVAAAAARATRRRPRSATRRWRG